jgi:hypothetical protein
MTTPSANPAKYALHAKFSAPDGCEQYSLSCFPVIRALASFATAVKIKMDRALNIVLMTKFSPEFA